jgi:hypothetical protein
MMKRLRATPARYAGVSIEALLSVLYDADDLVGRRTDENDTVIAVDE